MADEPDPVDNDINIERLERGGLVQIFLLALGYLLVMLIGIGYYSGLISVGN